MIIKITDTPGWDAGARTIATLSGNGYFSFSVGKAIGIVCGLNDADHRVHYQEIDHAFFIESNQFRIVENGSTKTDSAAYESGAVFKILRTNGKIEYFVDDELIYTSLKSSIGTVFGDCSLYSYLDAIVGAELVNLDVVTAELLIGPLGAIGVDADVDLSLASLMIGPLAVAFEEREVVHGTAPMGPLWSFGADGEAVIGNLYLGPLTGYGSEDTGLIPEYNAGTIYLGPIGVFAYEDLIPDSGFVEIGPLWTFGTDTTDDLVLGQAEIGPLAGGGYVGISRVLVVEWPTWSVVISARPTTFATHQSTYGLIAHQTNRATYQLSEIVALHETTWTQTAQAWFTTNYQSIITTVSAYHEANYASVGLSVVANQHEVSWSSFLRTTEFTIHESIYQTTTRASTYHEALFRSNIRVSTYHESLFRSNLRVSSTNTALYQSIPLTYSYQTTSYQSVVSDFNIHLATYQQVPNDYTTHTARYRSASMDAQAILANAYIEPAIQIVSAQVTADEDSPYYQCEVELLNSSDYRNFVRDQAFTLHLFDDSYAFVVDSKGLSRSIDEAGNYQEVATISGLSPLCLKASPRSEPVTKTWDSATYASAIVTELIGTVTWNLVDWQIPAYRLTIEKADPFEVAQQIVNAVGGLIESQPDGSVVVRHRWPTSIALLDTIVPATTLYENVIYSAQEQPTQDDLMNRIRILDTNASYQDRLEYVANKLSDGSNDPWTGWMYAYLSPWRNGLTIATTRGSKIQLGTQVEGTRAIFDDPDDAENIAELITFESGTGSVAYPIQTLSSVTWLDENLGGLTFVPYSTSLEASGRGNYYGYSLAEISYTTRYLKVPVICQESTDTIEAQFLLLENANG